MAVVIVCTAALLATVVWLAANRPRKDARATKKSQKSDDKQRERDAFYMQNFWNYDGSEQEEYNG